MVQFSTLHLTVTEWQCFFTITINNCIFMHSLIPGDSDSPQKDVTGDPAEAEADNQKGAHLWHYYPKQTNNDFILFFFFLFLFFPSWLCSVLLLGLNDDRGQILMGGHQKKNNIVWLYQIHTSMSHILRTGTAWVNNSACLFFKKKKKIIVLYSMLREIHILQELISLYLQAYSLWTSSQPRLVIDSVDENMKKRKLWSQVFKNILSPNSWINDSIQQVKSTDC